MFVNRQRLAIGYDAPLKDALLILDDCFEKPTILDNSTIRILFKQGQGRPCSWSSLLVVVTCARPFGWCSSQATPTILMMILSGGNTSST
jgi:hypothetical protein